MIDNIHEDRCYDLFLALDERSYRYRLENLLEEKEEAYKLVFTVDWKSISDMYGHRAGDEAIWAMSLALYDCFGMVIYRTAYGEFTWPDPDMELYEKNKDRLHELIKNWHGVMAPHTEYTTQYSRIEI
ncbi:MAG: hypothetical protein K6G43_08850 [Lachnospiraceae bacterium]|nr:hypothetical protein [Lachnospiraceae bacterium]